MRQRSCPLAITSRSVPSTPAASSRSRAGRISLAFSSSRGWKVPRNTAHLPTAPGFHGTGITDGTRQAPLSPTLLHYAPTGPYGGRVPGARAAGTRRTGKPLRTVRSSRALCAVATLHPTAEGRAGIAEHWRGEGPLPGTIGRQGSQALDRTQVDWLAGHRADGSRTGSRRSSRARPRSSARAHRAARRGPPADRGRARASARPCWPRRWPAHSTARCGASSSPPTCCPATSPASASTTSSAASSSSSPARCSPTSCVGDEINRASPKTQSALLECMEERQVTVDGTTYPLEAPFMVVATQNPIEMEGTYPLPEAQRDRFMARVSMGYPAPGRRAARCSTATPRPTRWTTCSRSPTPPTCVKLIETVRAVHVSDEVKRYVVDLVNATRDHLRPAPRRLAARHAAPGPGRPGHGRAGGPRLRAARRRQAPGRAGARAPAAARRAEAQIGRRDAQQIVDRPARAGCRSRRRRRRARAGSLSARQATARTFVRRADHPRAGRSCRGAGLRRLRRPARLPGAAARRRAADRAAGGRRDRHRLLAATGSPAAGSLEPARVPVGTPAQVHLRLENAARLPSGALLVEDRLPYVLGSRPALRAAPDRAERAPRGSPTGSAPSTAAASRSARSRCAAPTRSACSSSAARSRRSTR